MQIIGKYLFSSVVIQIAPWTPRLTKGQRASWTKGKLKEYVNVNFFYIKIYIVVRSTMHFLGEESILCLLSAIDSNCVDYMFVSCGRNFIHSHSISAMFSTISLGWQTTNLIYISVVLVHPWYILLLSIN